VKEKKGAEKAGNPKETSMVRSSAAEYLKFVAASGKGGVEAVYADENIWLTQKMMGVLYDVETQTVNYHLKKVFSDCELEEDSVIREFRITAADGKNYKTKHYNLSAIIAVGYKVNSERAVQFRKWATTVSISSCKFLSITTILLIGSLCALSGTEFSPWPDTALVSATDIDGAENGSFISEDTLIIPDSDEEYQTFQIDFLMENE